VTSGNVKTLIFRKNLNISAAFILSRVTETCVSMRARGDMSADKILRTTDL
jgi:hypothetical protein